MHDVFFISSVKCYFTCINITWCINIIQASVDLKYLELSFAFSSGKIQWVSNRMIGVSSTATKQLETTPSGTIGHNSRPDVARPLSVIQNMDGQCVLYTENGSEMVKHTLKSMTSRKVCAYCKFTGERFANGNIKQTFYHCETCNVPLCRFQSRECFLSYHKLKFQNSST